MGATVRLEVNDVWQQFYSTVGETVTWSNVGPSEFYVQESALAPNASEKGNPFPLHGAGFGKIEVDPLWVRCKDGDTAVMYFQKFGP